MLSYDPEGMDGEFGFDHRDYNWDYNWDYDYTSSGLCDEFEDEEKFPTEPDDICQTCDSTGEFPVGHVCKSCGGSGRC